MKDQCKQAVAQALGKQTLNAQEVAAVEKSITKTMQNLAREDRQKWQNMSLNDRISAAGQRIAQDILGEVRRKNKIAANDIIIQARNLNQLDHPSLPASQVVDRMIAPHGDMSGIQSFSSQARAIAGIYRGELMDFYTNVKGGIGVWTDKALVHDIIKERFGESSGNALAKQISNKMGEVFEGMRERFNRSGGDIGKLDNWALPQTHSAQKLIEAKKDQWVRDAENVIDREMYVKEDGSLYSDAEIKALLEYSYDSITSNGANKLEIGRNNFGGNSKVTSKHSESRVLHFKNADAWLEYQEKYGGMQFVDLVEAHINGLSKDIALVENLGSNPKGAMRILMDAARQKDWEKGVDSNDTKKGLNRSQVMFDEFMGANMPENEVLANIGLTYRSTNVASMLGGTTLASLTDQAMTFKTAQIHDIAYRKIFGEVIGQLNPKNKADRELAHSLGLATEEMLGTITRWSDDGLTSVHGKAEKAAKLSSSLATQVLRLSGLNALTAANKVGFSKMLMDKYGRLTREKSWNDLEAIDRELLQGTGLNERTWEIMRLAEPVLDRKGNQLMSARSIYQIPDNLLTQFGDPKRVRDEAASRFQAHLLDEQGMAVIEAGLREKTWMTGGLRKGTAMGEILRSMLQFKSFPAAMLMRHGSRTFSRPTTMSKATYGASLVALTSLLGAFVVQLREIVNGNDPLTMWDSDDPEKTVDFMKRSIAQGGGLAIMGDIVVAGMDPTGRSTENVLTGPFGSDVKTALNVTLGNATQLANGIETNAGNEAFKAIKGKIPGQNLWYTKAVLNRMIFDELQDTIAPGYREKVLRKAERQHDKTRFWGDDLSDIQMPDFERVVQ
ncbi:hypothetical protein DJ533_11980 [Acinetobacter defluvii]|uniref:Phage-like protein n=1 Tax=Acinetobacter defluvii TaxID=1871111 RepID=A0A2S2FE57_9GAMM|nr:hypothetical protein [Acinetobacter defluvii]AWL29234.1 hypothetical protein DJ533_11980 [Acinetobacter defluvii]